MATRSIMIAHSRSEEQLLGALATELRRLGREPRVEEALATCDGFVVLLTDRSAPSKNVLEEIARTLRRRRDAQRPFPAIAVVQRPMRTSPGYALSGYLRDFPDPIPWKPNGSVASVARQLHESLLGQWLDDVLRGLERLVELRITGKDSDAEDQRLVRELTDLTTDLLAEAASEAGEAEPSRTLVETAAALRVKAGELAEAAHDAGKLDPQVDLLRDALRAFVRRFDAELARIDRSDRSELRAREFLSDLTTLVESDGLSRFRLVDDLLVHHPARLTRYLADTDENDSQLASIVDALWEDFDYVLHMTTRELPAVGLELIDALTALDIDDSGEFMRQLRRAAGTGEWPAFMEDAREATEYIPTVEDRTTAWRTLAHNSPDSGVRRRALEDLEATDAWELVSAPGTPIAVMYDLLDKIIQEGWDDTAKLILDLRGSDLIRIAEAEAGPRTREELARLILLLRGARCLREKRYNMKLRRLCDAVTAGGGAVPVENFEEFAREEAGRGQFEKATPGWAGFNRLPIRVKQLLAEDEFYLRCFVTSPEPLVADLVLSFLRRSPDIAATERVIGNKMANGALLDELAADRNLMRRPQAQTSYLFNSKAKLRLAKPYIRPLQSRDSRAFVRLTTSPDVNPTIKNYARTIARR